MSSQIYTTTKKNYFKYFMNLNIKIYFLSSFTVMRLGKKKDRDPDNKFQVIEGIHRLVCSYKNSSLKGKNN